MPLAYGKVAPPSGDQLSDRFWLLGVALPLSPTHCNELFQFGSCATNRLLAGVASVLTNRSASSSALMKKT